MSNIVKEIKDSLTFSVEEISHGIINRAPGSNDSNLDISAWLEDGETIPKWAKRAAALWVVELWMEARDICEPTELLIVDKKYTQLLRGYSMGEIIVFRKMVEGQ